MPRFAYVHLVREDAEGDTLGRQGSIAYILEEWIDRCSLEFTLLERTTPAGDLHIAIVKLTPDEIRCEVGLTKRRSREVTIRERACDTTAGSPNFREGAVSELAADSMKCSGFVKNDLIAVDARQQDQLINAVRILWRS